MVGVNTIDVVSSRTQNCESCLALKILKCEGFWEFYSNSYIQCFNYYYFISSLEPRSCSDGGDIAFILDSSGSLGPRLYQKQKEFVKDVMKKLMNKCKQLNAGVVIFSTEAFVKQYFYQKFSLEKFNSVIDSLPFLRGFTRIDKGLLLAGNRIFSTVAGLRLHVSKVAILTTDGKQTKGPDTVSLYEASEPLKRKGVRVLAVGIGSYIDVHELTEVTERNEDVFLVKRFSLLFGLVDKLVGNIVSAIGKHRIIFKKV